MLFFLSNYGNEVLFKTQNNKMMNKNPPMVVAF